MDFGGSVPDKGRVKKKTQAVTKVFWFLCGLRFFETWLDLLLIIKINKKPSI
jgi:hypothetical protein